MKKSLIFIGIFLAVGVLMTSFASAGIIDGWFMDTFFGNDEYDVRLSPGDNDPELGLLLHWDVDVEDPRDILRDYSPNAIPSRSRVGDLLLSENPSDGTPPVDSKFGGALRLPGRKDKILYYSPDRFGTLELTYANEFTIDFWFYPFENLDSGDFQPLVYIEGLRPETDKHHFLRVDYAYHDSYEKNSVKLIGSNVVDDGAILRKTTQEFGVNVGEWNHVAVMVSEDKGYSLLLNGISTGWNKGLNPDLNLDFIGAYFGYPFPQHFEIGAFEGYIDEFRIVNNIALWKGLERRGTYQVPNAPYDSMINIPEENRGLIPSNRNVLCLYNENSVDSIEICNYYLSKRPGATKLGLDIGEDFLFDNAPHNTKWEIMRVEGFLRDVMKPLHDFVDSRNDLDITHLAIAKDVSPRLASGDGNGVSISAGHLISLDFDVDANLGQSSVLGSIDYDRTRVMGEHFRPENQQGDYDLKTRFAPSFLVGHSMEDIKKMIDKAQALAPNLETAKWMIDRDVDGFSINEQEINFLYQQLGRQGIGADKIIAERTDARGLVYDDILVAYGGPGDWHANYHQHWIAHNPAVIANTANRAIFMSYESYNAATFEGGASSESVLHQGLVVDAMSPGAFGGSDYSGSFSGGIGHVDEPSLGGVGFADRFFGAYASGLTLAESYLSAIPVDCIDGRYGGFRNYDKCRNIAIGDPLMRITDENKFGVGGFCENGDQCFSGFCGEDLEGVKRCKNSADSCVVGSKVLDIPSDGFSGSCVDDSNIRLCVDGVFQEQSQCASNTVCVSFGKGELNFERDFCGLVNGETCSEDEECLNLKCSADLFGVKRCTSQNSCILGYGGETTLNENYACIDENSKKLCQDSVWQAGEVNCDGECRNGLCEEEWFTAPSTFNIADGQYPIYSPVDSPDGSMIGDVFNEFGVGSLYPFVTEENRYLALSKGFIGLIGDREIKDYEGFLIENILDEIDVVNIQGDLYSESVPIKLEEGDNFVGIAHCAERYSASEILEELDSLNIDCNSIFMPTIGRGPVQWYSSSDEQDLDYGIKRDFGLKNHEAYFIRCGEGVDTTWTPSCPEPIVDVALTLDSSDLSQVYTGNRPEDVKSVDYILPEGVPNDLNVIVSYDPSTPRDRGTYIVTATVNQAGYSGFVTGTLEITKGEQTITFDAISDKKVDDELTLSASSSSGLDVGFEISEGEDLIRVLSQGSSGHSGVTGNVISEGENGSNVFIKIKDWFIGLFKKDVRLGPDLINPQVKFIGAGEVSITAKQLGDNNWNAASEVIREFEVECGNDFVRDGSSCVAKCIDDDWQSTIIPVACPVEGMQTLLWSKKPGVV